MDEPTPNFHDGDDEERPYAQWELSRERQTHEWRRIRRAIVSTRIRLLVVGHVMFFSGCLLIDLLGDAELSSHFTHIGWYSLLLTSASLLLAEWLHVRFPPRAPARFVVRGTGVTEYGDEGPRHHIEWSRTRQLRLECDRDRPDFHNLILVLGGPRCLERLHRIAIPLPQPLAATGELQALAAVGSALAENGFDWTAHWDCGHIDLVANGA